MNTVAVVTDEGKSEAPQAITGTKRRTMADTIDVIFMNGKDSIGSSTTLLYTLLIMANSSKSVITVILAIAVIGIGFFWFTSANAHVASVNIYSGSAEIRSGSHTTSATNGTAVRAKDVIKVGKDSRVSIILRDGSVFRLEAGSEVTITDLLYKGDSVQTLDVEVTTGRMWSKMKPLETGANVDVETPTIVASVRGTSFNVDYLQKVSTVYVSSHSVTVGMIAPPHTEVTLTEGQIIHVNDNNPGEDILDGTSQLQLEDKDGWIIFNETEDAKLDGRTTVISSSSTSSVSSRSSQAVSSAKQMTLSSRANTAPVSSTKAATPSSAATTTVKSSSRASSTRSVATTKKVTKLTLTADSTSLQIQEKTPLHLIATYSDGSSTNDASGVSWTILPGSAGYIDGSHAFLALESGKVLVGATVDGVRSNSITINVQSETTAASTPTSQASAEPQVTSMTVRCAKLQSSNPNQQYAPSQCTAMATYSDGKTNNVTQQSSWSVTGSAAGQVNSSGYYTPAQKGSATVTAQFNGSSGSVTFNVP